MKGTAAKEAAAQPQALTIFAAQLLSILWVKSRNRNLKAQFEKRRATESAES
jgi:hypothetical protein